MGWNSSYTGKPIAEEQMREQVEQTIARVLALRPQRVLEIGCGTGLLLSRVAPSTQRYVGTDFSPEILGWLGQQEAVQGLPQVQLLQRVAHDVNGLQQERFDLVILNSTVQYSRSVEYLVEVVQQVLPLLEPAGTMLVGDVRSLRHLELYHTSVQLFRAEESLRTGTLRERIGRQVRREEELVLEPAFFAALQAAFPRLGRCGCS